MEKLRLCVDQHYQLDPKSANAKDFRLQELFAEVRLDLASTLVTFTCEGSYKPRRSDQNDLRPSPTNAVEEATLMLLAAQGCDAASCLDYGSVFLVFQVVSFRIRIDVTLFVLSFDAFFPF